MHGRRERLLSLCLSFGSILLTFAAVEGVAQVARYRGPGKEAAPGALYTEFDPLLGWRKRPMARAIRRTREYTVEISTNSLGLRDDERRFSAPAGTFRILALGDSFVEAYSVPLRESVTQVLERSLRAPAEVINGGTAGYDTAQEYLFYSAEGRRFAPNIVLLFFYFNDVVFNGRSDYFGSPTPLFSLRDGMLVAPVPLAAPAPRFSTPDRRTAPAPGARGLASVQWLRERLMTGAPTTYDRLASLGLWPKVERQVPHLQLRVYKRKRIPEIEAAWDLTARLLERIANDVEADGAKLCVVYVPSLIEVSDRSWVLSRFRYGMDDERWDRRGVINRLQAIASKAGLRVLDLTPALHAAERRFLGGAYFAHDGHWNSTGHRIAAVEVRRFLGVLGWLPEPAAALSIPGKR